MSDQDEKQKNKTHANGEPIARSDRTDYHVKKKKEEKTKRGRGVGVKYGGVFSAY